MAKRWTEDEVSYVINNYPKMTCKELAKRFGRSHGSVRAKVRRLGLDRGDYWSYEEVKYLKDSYKDKTYKEIGEKIGRKTNAVKAKVYRLGLPDKTRKIEMSGKIFGRLTVVRETEKRSDKGSVIWECLCNCGGRINVPTSQLTFNKTTSCGCVRENMVGKNHPAYNPDLSDEDRRRKRYLLGEVWTRDLRVKVFERDNYACVSCNKKGGDMNAHHLNGWDMHVEQRFDINNLVTLCESCHKKFHGQFGYGNNTKEQFEEYLKTLD